MDLQKVIKLANDGDTAAMYALFEYYEEQNQRDIAEDWLYKSADNGYLQAIYVSVPHTIFKASTFMRLEVHEEALKAYVKGWNYLSLLTKENGVPQEVINTLIEKDYYNKLYIGIASCLILTKNNKSAYEFLEGENLSDEKKVLKGIAILRMDDNDDDEQTKTGLTLLKTIITNKNLNLDDWILAYAYTYLIQGYLHFSPSLVGCSSKNEATEKAYHLALEASQKGGHTGSIGEDVLGHFRKKFFGGYEYIG